MSHADDPSRSPHPGQGRGVRGTLLALGCGVVTQRILQLITFVCIGNALGAERLGVYATGLAAAAILAVLSGAGVRNLLAREVASRPDAARQLLLTAVRSRLGFGLLLAVPALGATFAWSSQPWFFAICLLQVFPAAFDLKNLLDASGRTAAEVALETTAAALQLALVGAWCFADGDDLVGLAVIALLCRGVYAGGAMFAIARLPRRATRVHLPDLARRGAAVSLGQTAHEVMATADVWLVAMLLGDAAAGLYAVAVRIALAAMVPSAQLARLLLPHLLRSTAAGDPTRTTRTALRATAFATLPLVAGGAIVAEPLCRVVGAEFAFAGDALRLVLMALALQHIGWQISHRLFADRRDHAYAIGLLLPALLHAGLLGLVSTGGSPGAAAAAMLAGHGLYLLIGLCQQRDLLALLPRAAAPAVLVAAATAAAAALTGATVAGNLGLLLQLTAGGLAAAVTLWLVELRGRLTRIGDGLAAASGLVQPTVTDRR